MDSMFVKAAAFNQNIDSWDVSNVKNMLLMFYKATAFNQNIDSWDVSNVKSVILMFYEATAFNQSIGSWDISSLTNAEGMFIRTAMTVDNMDDTLRGWAKLDTAAGETAIKNNVTWDIEDYTDATAKQYLIDTYNWTINGTFDGSKTIQGTITADTLATTSIKTTLHGLGGNDTLTGGTTNDILIGGAGDDTLTGAGGRNTFDYGFENAGNDIITDFTVGNTSINANADIIDLKDLLIGYSISNLSDFVTAAADGTGTKLTIDHNSMVTPDSQVTIALTGVSYSTNLLSGMITDGNLVLE
ncbi:Chitinase [uncultured Candidatus Thioglobus sp.]|nr:Chitinase [uncultured Candidatus Thioglobus sp.]